MSGPSGVEVTSAVVDAFQHMKLKKDKAWMVAKLTADKTKVEIDETVPVPDIPKDGHDEAENRANFEKLKENLKNEEPRFIVFDFRFMNDGGQKIGKLGYIAWVSDEAPVKLKMVYSSTSNTMKKMLSGINVEFQVNDQADFDYSSMKLDVERK